MRTRGVVVVLFTTLIGLLMPSVASGIHHDLDPTFGVDGFAFHDFGESMLDGGATEIEVIDSGPDAGKILVAGTVTPSPGEGATQQWRLARLLPDGSLDPGFAAGGVRRFSFGPGTSATLGDMEVDSQGRILLAGWLFSFGGHFVIARLNPNGFVDDSQDADPESSFSEDGVDFGQVPGCGPVTLQEMTIYPAGHPLAGRIAVAGSCDSVYPPTSTAVGRFTDQGLPDPSFGDGNGWVEDLDLLESDPRYEFVTGATVGRDGSLIISGGVLTDAEAERHSTVVRLDGAGVMDRSFGVDGRAEIGFGLGPTRMAADDVTFDPAMDRLVLSGTAGDRTGLIALDADSGAYDTSFSADGRVLTDVAPGVRESLAPFAVLTDGSIAQATTTRPVDPAGNPTSDIGALKYTPSGGLNPNFSDDGIALETSPARASAIAVDVDADGRIVVAGGLLGSGSRFVFAFARFMADRVAPPPEPPQPPSIPGEPPQAPDSSTPGDHKRLELRVLRHRIPKSARALVARGAGGIVRCNLDCSVRVDLIATGSAARRMGFAGRIGRERIDLRAGRRGRLTVYPRAGVADQLLDPTASGSLKIDLEFDARIR